MQIFGARQREIKIYVNPDRLRAYNLSVNQVSQAIRRRIRKRRAARSVEGAKTTALRTISKITSVEDFNEVVITTRNGFPIKVKDIGRVVDAGVDATTAASLDSVPSVTVAIRKQSGSNTVAVINGVKERMAQITPILPPDLKVAVVRDQSEFIQNSLARD